MLYFDFLATMFFILGGLSRIQFGKSKLLAFKIARNWRGFPLQARYLVRNCTCCAHHVVHFTLVLDFWLGKSFWLRWPKTCFWAPDPLLEVYDGILIHRIILDKARSCLWKLENGFWTYGLVNHLGPNYAKLSFRSKYFLILDNFIGFNLLFGRK